MVPAAARRPRAGRPGARRPGTPGPTPPRCARPRRPRPRSHPRARQRRLQWWRTAAATSVPACRCRGLRLATWAAYPPQPQAQQHQGLIRFDAPRTTELVPVPLVAQLGSVAWASSASGAAGRRRVPASLPDLGDVEQLFPYGNFYAGLQDRAWSSRRATSPTWPRCGVPLPRRQAAGPLQHLEIFG